MSELTEIMTAIGGLDGKVDGLSETVGGQGVKIDLLREDVSAIKATCVAHKQQTDGIHRTLYGATGRNGLTDEVASNTKTVAELVETNKERRGLFWKIVVPVIVAVIIGAGTLLMTMWNRL